MVNALGSKIKIGLKLENNFYMESGFEVQYSLNENIFFKATYLTSRVAVSQGKNDLLKDDLIFSAGYYLTTQGILKPYILLNLGYSTFDIENQDIFGDLNNQSFIFSITPGINITLFQNWNLYGDMGYSFIQSSTILPLVFSTGLSYEFK